MTPATAPVTMCDRCQTARATVHIASTEARVDYQGEIVRLVGDPAYGSLNLFGCEHCSRHVVNQLEAMGCRARLSGLSA